MCCRIVLPDRDVLVRVFQNRAAIAIHVQVVGGGEDGDDGRKVAFGGLAIHGISMKEFRREHADAIKERKEQTLHLGLHVLE
jgi:hypothetical protein